MKAWKGSARALLLPAVLMLGGAGCSLSGTTNAPDGGDSLYVDRDPPQTELNGVSFDPEAVYMYQQFICPDPCPSGAPALATYSPPFMQSLVAGGQVHVVDPLTGNDAATVTQTGLDGRWSAKVPQRNGAPYFTQEEGGAIPPSSDPDVVALPPVTYVSTHSLRPLPTGSSSVCASVPAPMISDSGIVQAVARYLGVSVSDLLDPGQAGGVAVIWLYRPDFFVNIGTAAGTSVESTLGTVFNIGWKFPGTGDATQSDRGFYVDTSSPVSALGLSVVLFDAAEAGQVATLTGHDPVEDAAAERPWTTQPMDITVTPGSVAYAGFQMTGITTFPANPNFCTAGQVP